MGMARRTERSGAASVEASKAMEAADAGEYWAEEAYLDAGRYAGAEGVDSEMFAHTALSLGMDNDDLLFNLMYFEEGQGLSLVMNSVQQETIALHSENNTPYKLCPASEHAISGLSRQHFSGAQEDCECAVCKCEMEEGEDVLVIPVCKHVFHEVCLSKWLRLQGFCPVCRAPIGKEDEPEVGAYAGVEGEYTPRVEGPSDAGDTGAMPFSDERPHRADSEPGADEDMGGRTGMGDMGGIGCVGGVRADSKPLDDLDGAKEKEQAHQAEEKGAFVDMPASKGVSKSLTFEDCGMNTARNSTAELRAEAKD
ncbi:hypothetical protein B484DRAFT_418461 [Ochromonadaceae sp. CCMP2298]|nr:hypothetical protein B484DRAFT_418461 [Ochromonadaceae sp. CCMP2298]